MIFTIPRRRKHTWLPWFAWRPVRLTKTQKASQWSDKLVPEPDHWYTGGDIQIAWMCWVKRYDSGMSIYYTKDEVEVSNGTDE